MRDFTLEIFKKLLQNLQRGSYSFQTFQQFMHTPEKRMIILRHDVDKKPSNSLIVAQIETQLGVRGTYYFRTKGSNWNGKIIEAIAGMGHEIGYHYENMETCGGNIDKAFEDFQKNLEKVRKITDVKTICMHGSPRSKFNNKDLWKKYDYKKTGIVGEPYIDIDFTKVLYLTDTGRCWNGNQYSIRDKVNTSFDMSFHRTHQIIYAAENKTLPDQIMFTFHPQRWTNEPIPWSFEFLSQNFKNQLKFLAIHRKKKRSIV